MIPIVHKGSLGCHLAKRPINAVEGEQLKFLLADIKPNTFFSGRSPSEFARDVLSHQSPVGVDALRDVRLFPLRRKQGKPSSHKVKGMASYGIQTYAIQVPYLPEVWQGKSVLFLSDLHFGRFDHPQYWAKVLKDLDGLKADLVILGGDYINRGPQELERVEAFVKAIQAPLGKFAVMGNHDYLDTDDGKAVREVLMRSGVQLLDNTSVNVMGLWLSGVDDDTTQRAEVAAAVRNVPKEAAHLGVSHNPSAAEAYAQQPNGPSFVFSGHTHGLRAPLARINRWLDRWLQEKSHGKFGIFFDWISLYPAKALLYVTSGIGHSLMLDNHKEFRPHRFGSPAEMVLFRLERAPQETPTFMVLNA